MKYGSVCSGVEAATVAWHDLGWEPQFFSEFDEFPSAVLKNHYPDVPNYGDMTKYKDWNLNDKSIDLLVGGTPCQSFSISGLRKGLRDDRGNLMLEYLRMADEFKHKWILIVYFDLDGSKNDVSIAGYLFHNVEKYLNLNLQNGQIKQG